MALPPELKDKTPEEIAAYYEARERIIVDRAETARKAAADAAEKKTDAKDDEKFDLYGDPHGSVTRVVEKHVTAQVDRISANAAPALIKSAEYAAKDGKADWSDFADDIKGRMSKMSQEAQMNPDYWDMTYKMVKGEKADELVARARAEATNPSPKPSAKADPPPAPRELSSEERSVAEKFGMTTDKYRDAADRFNTTDGRLPLTVDSKNPKQKRAERKAS